MGKLKHSVLVLGEGPTEFYYFNSLRDVFRGMTIKPDYPKHTSMKELEEKIEKGIADGYDRVFCVIDMDTKDEEPERSQYMRLKKKYANPVNKPKQGVYCEVRFFETHRCTELFFLYYFRYTARMYNDQSALLLDLKKQCGYEKTIDFFRKAKDCILILRRKEANLTRLSVTPSIPWKRNLLMAEITLILNLVG